MAAHIPDLFPDAVALSSSALAAPGFVSAAIDGESGGRFELGGRLIVVAHLGRAGPLEHDPWRWRRMHPDRSVDMLPDGDPADPDLIVIDVLEPGTPRLDGPPTPSRRGHDGAGRPARRAVAPFRDRIRAPEQRLLRFGTALVVLALASAHCSSSSPPA